jgi:hypothetical protein
MARETIIKRKMTIILPIHEAGHHGDIGQNQVCPTEPREYSFHCAQMDESTPGMPEIPLEILWSHLSRYCFDEQNFRGLR